MIRSPQSVRSDCPGATNGRSRRGFSLIELVLALTVAAIIVAVTMPRIDFTALRADAGARLVSSTLSYASRTAVLRQHDVIVSFDIPQSRLRIANDMNNNGLIDTGERVTYKPLEDGIGFFVPVTGLTGGVPAAAATGPTMKTISGEPSVVFHRNGSSSSDVEAYLAAPRKRNTDFRAVTIVKATARVDHFRNTQTGWLKAGV